MCQNVRGDSAGGRSCSGAVGRRIGLRICVASRLLAGVFLAAGASKVLFPADQVPLLYRVVRLESPVTEFATASLVAVDVVLAGMFLTVRWRARASVAAIGFVLLSTALLTSSHRLGEAIHSCGCFGRLAPLSYPAHLVLNGVLLLLALLTMELKRSGTDVQDLSQDGSDA